MRLPLLLIFVALPLVELALLIKAGETIGFWPTLGLLAAAAVLGVIVVRQQGLSMVGRMFATINEGKPSVEPLLEGYALIIAGLLLILPGFLSDVLGLLLLVGPVRKWGIRRVIARLMGAPREPKRTVVIEGSYERVDDNDPDKGPRGR